jgi:predicted tellurium resistance membrane protein TerC
MALVVLGLLISIPIVVWGSTLVLRLINRHPWIVHVGVRSRSPGPRRT